MANGQQINVNMKFNADVSQAKQQIQELQKSLSSVIEKNAAFKFDGSGIDSAIQSAQQLKMALEQATSVKTGKLDFAKFNATLKSFGTDVSTIGMKLTSLGPEGQKAFSQLGNAIANAEIPTKRLNSALVNFGDTLIRTIRWQLASSMIHGFMSTVSSAVGYIENLDKSLNSIQLVTQKNSNEMANFARQANKMAGELSTVTKEYADASLIYFQQGLDTDEVIKRTNVTIELVKVTGESVQQISSELTAIWNNFDNGSKSLEYYADVITALGATTASSSSEIAQGLSKFAAVADTVGLSYERATAALATVVAETRQSADIVGTSFKTIFARLEGLKLGETLEDGVDLNQYSAALAKVGVNILDQEGNLKDMDDILDSISERWNKLGRAQQVALAQSVAGIRQYSQFMALMENYDKVIENERTARESKGTLGKQFDVYQDSIEALNKSIEKAKQDVFDSLFDGDAVKGFKNVLLESLQFVENIVKNFGGLKGIILTIGGLLLSNYLPKIEEGLGRMWSNFKDSWGFTRREIEQTTASMIQDNQVTGQRVLNGANVADTNSYEIEAALQSKILQIRQEINKNADYYSQTQKQMIENSLQELTAQKDALVNSKEELETLKKKNEESEKQSNREFLVTNNRSRRQFFSNESPVQTSILENFSDIDMSNSSEIQKRAQQKITEITKQVNENKDKQKELQRKINDATGDEKSKIEDNIRELDRENKLLQEKITLLTKISQEPQEEIKDIQYRARRQNENLGYAQQNAQIEAGLIQNAGGPDATETSGFVDALNENNNQIVTELIPNLEHMQYIFDETTGQVRTITKDSEEWGQNLKISENNMRALAKEAGGFRATQTQTEKIIKNIRQALDQSAKAQNKQNQSTKQSQKNMQEVEKYVTAVQKQATQLVDSFDESSTQGKILSQEIQDVKTALGNIKPDGQGLKELEEAMTRLSNASKDTALDVEQLAQYMASDLSNGSKEARQRFLDIINSSEDAETKTRLLAQAFKDLKGSMDDSSQQIPSIFSTLKTGAQEGLQGITSLSMGVQMAKSGIDSLSDSIVNNGSVIQKLASIVMILRGAMMAAEGATKLWTAAKAAGKAVSILFTKNIVKETGAVGVNTAAQAGNATMTGIANAARKGGVIAAAAAAVAMAGITGAVIAHTVNLKKEAAATEAENERLTENAEKARESAAATKEEYEEIKKLYDEYSKIYNVYKNTGNGKQDLYDKTKDLLEALGMEDDMVLLLSGHYDLLNKKIKEKAKEEAKRSFEEAQKARREATGAFVANANAKNGGAMTDDFGEGRFGVFNEEVQDKNTYSWGYGHTPLEIQRLYDFLVGKYGLSTNDSKLINNYTESIARIQEEIRKRNPNQEVALSTWDSLTLEQQIAVINDLLSQAGFDLAEVSLGQNEATGNVAKVKFDFSDTAAGQNQALTFLEEYKPYAEGANVWDSNNSIGKRYSEWEETGDLEYLQKNKEQVQADINGFLSYLFADLDFSDIGSIEEARKAKEKLENRLREYIEAETGFGLTSEAAVNNFITQFLPNLDTQIRNESGKYGNLLLLENELRDKTGKEDLSLESIANKIGLSIDELAKLADEGYFFDINMIDPNGNIEDQIKALLKRSQEIANEQPIEIQYSLVQSAAKGWKKSMSYDEILSWIKQNEDLFGDGKIISMDINDWLDLAYEEQQQILQQALTPQKIQAYNTKKKGTYEQYLSDWKKGIYTDEQGNKQNAAQYLANELSMTDYDQALLDYYLFSNKVSQADKDSGINSLIEKYPDLEKIYGSMQKTIDSYRNKVENLNDELERSEKFADSAALHDWLSIHEIDTDEFDAYVTLLQEENKQYADLYDSIKDYNAAMVEVAKANKLMEKGVKALSSDWDKYDKIMSNSKASMEDVSTVLPDINDALQDVLNLDSKDFALLPPDFAKKNWKLINDVVNGVEGSVDKLRDKAGQEILLNIGVEKNWSEEVSNTVNELHNAIAQYDNEHFTVGVELDPVAEAKFYNACNGIIQAAGMTKDQAEAYFANMGYDVELEEITDEQFTPWHVDNPIYDAEQSKKAGVPIFSGTEPLEGRNYTKTSVVAVKSITPNGSYGGGIGVKKTAPKSAQKSSSGGGGGSRSRKEPKKSEDEIERYHVIDKTIDSLSKKYDRLSAAKDAAFGKQRLKYIEQENKLLQQQYTAEKKRLEEVEKYYRKDRGAIEAYGAIIDNNGVITNYDQIMQQQLDKLNSIYTTYNNGGSSDEAVEAAEKDYEAFKKILDQFEKTNTEYLNQVKRVEDAIREQLSNELEGIKAKVEVELELPEQQLKMLEFKLKTLDNLSFKAAERIALWGEEAEVATQRFNKYADAVKEILMMSVTDENGNKLGGFGFTEDQTNRLLSGDYSVLDEANITGDNAQEIMTLLKEYQDSLIEEYGNLADKRASIEEELFNELGEYQEGIENYVSKIEKLTSIVTNIKNLVGTLGKSTLGITQDVIDQINNTLLGNMESQIAIFKAEKNALETSLGEARIHLQEAIASNDEEAIQYWQKANNEIESSLLDTTDSLLSMVNDYATQATEILSEKIQASFDEMARQIYGMTLAEAQSSYDRYNTASQDYLYDYQKIYELSKLTRDIENSIDNTDNIRAKQLLRDLEEEIYQYQADGVKMTQYQLDYLTKMYELRQAQIALEEAQNATDKVRLSRNADGGWGYVYTADQANIDKAQQNYEDKLYAVQQLNQQTIEDSQSTILQLEQEFQDAILEIVANAELSEAEKNKRIEELRQYYLDRLQVYYDTLDQALANNRQLYENDWAEYNRLTGYRISADENYLDKFEETWLGTTTGGGILGGITTVKEAFEDYQNKLGSFDASGTVLGDTYTALENYKNGVSGALSAAGLSIENFSGNVSEYMKNVKTETGNAETAAKGLAKELEENLPNTMNSVASWQSKINEKLQEMGNTILGVAGAIQALITSLNNLDDTKATFTIDYNLPAGDLSNQVINEVIKALKGSGLLDEDDDGHEDRYRKVGGVAHSSAGQNQRTVMTFASGGYTGEWGPEGRIAMLHEKELVLNKQDTANMLQMVEAVKNMLNPSALNLPKIIAQNLANVNLGGGNAPAAQQIAIEAHFPNVTNHFEIEEAFRNLANYSSQNAYNFDLTQKVNFF